MEQFAIPAAGAIIVKEAAGQKLVLTQVRAKRDAPHENGLLEIPAGKIRAFESIGDAIRREVKEETGLTVVEIQGEALALPYEANEYQVVDFAPFACAQNLSGRYPVMVFTFICQAEGELLPFSDESREYRWLSIAELAAQMEAAPQTFYPMHVPALKKYVAACG